MPNQLYRNLLTLRRLLTECANWRLTPAQWERTSRAVEELARHLAARDERGIDAVLRQIEDVEPGSRVVTRIDDPRRVGVPEPLYTRVVELVPVIVEQLAWLDGSGSDTSGGPAPPARGDHPRYDGSGRGPSHAH